jgi:hypothetical protein
LQTIIQSGNLLVMNPLPSPRTRHTELLLLCARIGYSPPALGQNHL